MLLDGPFPLRHSVAAYYYYSCALGKRRYTTYAPDYLCDLIMRFQPMHLVSTNQSFGYWFVDRRHQAQNTCLNYPPPTAGSEGGGGANLDSVLPCRRMRHISEAHIGRTPQKININSALFDCKM